MRKQLTRDFVSLKDEWYQKLKESGFQDIEDTKGSAKADEIRLSQWHSAYFQSRYTENTFIAKRDYYTLAGQFLHDHDFKSKQEKSIWFHHSEGESARQIGKRFSLYHNRVDALIKSLAAKMLDQIEVRSGVEADQNFIYTTWIKGLYSDSHWLKAIPKCVFTGYQSAIIKKMLANPDVKVRVACLSDDSDIILGYSVTEGNRLHFVFIKPDWRGKGLGILKSLIPNEIDEVTAMTKAGKKRMPESWTYQPFYL